MCPILLQKETDLDCPWAGVVRELETTAPEKVTARLLVLAPELMNRLGQEAKTAGAMKQLWGRSINFDESVKKIIVPNPILDAILTHAKVEARGTGALGAQFPERIVHAGFEHTYGYLLSNLQTPYGFKRLRWVRPDIENGFGLPTGTISALPEKGGLFSNITHFAGHIAFRGENVQDKAARKILSEAMGVSDALRGFNYKSIHGRRLVETLRFRSGRTVEIRTDFVPFTSASDEATGGNTELLIYSFLDSELKLPYLVTAFPIGKGFSDMATNPSGLGEVQKITTRYNAWVPGVTESKTPLTGSRSVTTF